MGVPISQDTIKVLKAIQAAGSLSVIEAAAALTEPLSTTRQRMHNMAKNGLIVGETQRHAGKQYSLTPTGSTTLNLAGRAAADAPDGLVATPRAHSFGMAETYTPESWQCRAGSLAFLSLPSRGLGA